MNILILTESFPPRAGGSGWSTYYLACALKKRGHNVAVAKIKGEEERYENIEIANVKTKKELIKFIDEFHPDVIHCQHRISTIWGVGHGIPTTTTIRDYWHTCYDGTCFNERTQKNYEKETLGTIIQALTYKKPRHIRFLSPFIAVYLFFRTKYSLSKLKKCDALICNSTYTYEITKKALPRMKCTIIPNLIDFEKLATINPHHFEGRTVLYAGKLTKNKGAHIIIDAALKTKTKAKYIFIGEGELEKYISAKAKENKIDAEFSGYLPNDKVLSMMKGADALVLPALWNEPLGRTHLEGVGVGARIITTDTGGTRDIIEDYYNGLFFDKTPADLAKKIDLLLTNKKLAENITKNALLSAKKFDEKTVAEKFERFYKELIKK